MPQPQSPPAWFRAVVNEVDVVPVEDLKANVASEALALAALLQSGNGSEQERRERLLRVKMLSARILEAMHRLGRMPAVPPVAAERLRPRLANAAARLPRALERHSEAGRAARLYEVKVLCHRLLQLMLLGLLGCLFCPCLHALFYLAG